MGVELEPDAAAAEDVDWFAEVEARGEVGFGDVGEEKFPAPVPVVADEPLRLEPAITKNSEHMSAGLSRK